MISKMMTAAVGAMALFGISSASALPFTITSGSFTVGTGYGTGNNQLDVVFTSLVTPQSFNLEVGETQSFLFGSANLREDDISQSETGSLGVTANLTFTSPLASTVVVVASTGAFVGAVTDAGTDYFIDFSPVTVNFGVGGSFIVDVGDLFFNTTGTITNGANVTLTAVPVPVPEPASLALFGAGLLGLGLVRRRRDSKAA